MTVPVKSLNDEQKSWYANVVISAILADGEISHSEVDFLRQVISIVSEEERAKLMARIEKKTKQELEPHPNIPDQILAAIFLELILIVISDVDFSPEEREFLESVSKVMGFTKNYHFELMKWCETGLNWKVRQRALVMGSMDSVPIKDLTPPQKKWYASCLVTSVMVDGVVDEMEMAFLKMAIAMLDDPKEQKQMMAHVKNRMPPTLTAPPAGFDRKILTMIFIEIILIVTADEALSFKEKHHLQTISNLCRLEKSLFDKLVEWGNEGILWKQQKSKLIARVQVEQTAESHLEVSKENNSLLVRNFNCYICESDITVRFYQLRPQTQKVGRNIFGIKTYNETFPGYKQIDYNQAAIAMCPHCYFASINKNHFRINEKDKPPKELADEKFKNYWLSTVDQRHEKLGNTIEEIEKAYRPLDLVINAYEIGVEACEMMYRVSQDPNMAWGANAHRLVLAEILQANDKQKLADQVLKDVVQSAEKVFKSGDMMLALKAARILFLTALYFEDKQQMSIYLVYFNNLRDTEDKMNDEEKKAFAKIYGEVKKAFEDRVDYNRKNLEGFQLKR